MSRSIAYSIHHTAQMSSLALLTLLLASASASVGATARPLAQARPSCAVTNHAATLLPGIPTNATFQVHTYGRVLADNKARLLAGMDACGTPPAQKTLFMAMAMVETNTMSIHERDVSKDNRTDGGANVSIFNLNVDMIRRLGYRGDVRRLNDPARVSEAVCLMRKGIAEWGVLRMLAFVRGGYQGWVTGTAFGVRDFHRTVATIMSVIDWQPALMRDGRRVAVDLNWV